MTLLAVWSPLLLLVLITNCFTSVEGAAYIVPEKCPEGIRPGENWNPSEREDTVLVESSGCVRCTCHASGQEYGCYSCGVYYIEPLSPECYTTKVDPHAAYPACCDVEQRCPGDPRYDPSEITGNIG